MRTASVAAAGRRGSRGRCLLPSSPPASAAARQDDRVGGQFFAVGETHAAGPSIASQDLADRGVEAKARAPRARNADQGLGNAVHACAHQPDAVLLDMRDQHQRGRRLEGRRTAVGGIATEQLAQASIGEVVAERLPQRDERRNAQQVRQAAQPRASGQRKGPGARGARDGSFECAVGAPRARAELDIAARGLCARKFTDGLRRPVHIGMQVELFTRRPGVAREDAHRLQIEMIGKVCAHRGEQLFENPAHREHGRSGIHRVLAGADLAPCFAAWRARARSSTRTSTPCAASSSALTSPPIPAPITMTRFEPIACPGDWMQTAIGV